MRRKKQEDESQNNMIFPLSSIRTIKSTRRIAREKVLQVLFAYFISGTSIEELLKDIFSRDYNFEGGVVEKDDTQNFYRRHVLTKEEIEEIDADATIIWRDEDIEFAKILIRKVVENQEFIIDILKKISINWEYDRISIIDRTLIMIAVVEFIYCSEVPVKVSINEVINISKIYSTDKSTVFINGILDKFLVYLKENDKIHKTGRGID